MSAGCRYCDRADVRRERAHKCPHGTPCSDAIVLRRDPRRCTICQARYEDEGNRAAVTCAFCMPLGEQAARAKIGRFVSAETHAGGGRLAPCPACRRGLPVPEAGEVCDVFAAARRGYAGRCAAGEAGRAIGASSSERLPSKRLASISVEVPGIVE